MTVKDKLDAIDYVCNHCQEGLYLGCIQHSGDHPLIMQAEDRFDHCSKLRQRVFKMDKVFCCTIWREQLKQ